MPKATGIQLEDSTGAGEVMDVKIAVTRDDFGKIAVGAIVGKILEQNKALVLVTHQGEAKFRPDLGVGLQDLLLGEDYLEFRGKVRDHLAKDGLIAKAVDLYPGRAINIEADYE